MLVQLTGAHTAASYEDQIRMEGCREAAIVDMRPGACRNHHSDLVCVRHLVAFDESWSACSAELCSLRPAAVVGDQHVNAAVHKHFICRETIPRCIPLNWRASMGVP